MLTKEKIIELFHKLNEALRLRNEIGEIGIVGGAVMCVVYNARAATKDVDAIFEPTAIIRELAQQLAFAEGLTPDWLNDAVKGFLLPGFVQQEVCALSHLRVWAPEPRYMLAMKSISARWDSHDKDDVLFLIKHLNITSAQGVFEIIEAYYPRSQIPTKTSFFIEELFQQSV